MVCESHHVPSNIFNTVEGHLRLITCCVCGRSLTTYSGLKKPWVTICFVCLWHVNVSDDHDDDTSEHKMQFLNEGVYYEGGNIQTYSAPCEKVIPSHPNNLSIKRFVFGCGGILAHSSLQSCCNSATLEDFIALTAFLRFMLKYSSTYQHFLLIPETLESTENESNRISFGS